VALTVAPAAIASARADDESYWRGIAALYDRPEGVVQLENGNWGAMARPVLEAYLRHQTMVNRQTSLYARGGYAADLAAIRVRLAAVLGVGADEIAFTRNATEALQALIGGYNRLRAGDAVLYADLDYPAMQSAMDWLRARRGVDVVRIAIPEPATHQGLIDAYAGALEANPRVRLILLTHLGHRTGLVLPVAEIVSLARARRVDTIVDAAHSWGQLDFKLPSLGASFIGLNLHKWIGAPLGVGALYIARDRLADIDPFMAGSEAATGGVDARVHTGTANFAAYLTVAQALDFHARVGPAAKEARLRYLRDRWAEPLRSAGSLEILTPPDPRLHAGITSFRLRGRTSANANAALARELLDRFGIHTVHRTGVAAGACVRVTPALFTLEPDIDRLIAAVRAIGHS